MTKITKTPVTSQKRYPLYLRVLQQLKQRGVERVMSYQIGNLCGVKADTVRRDLMYVKHDGKTASGYDVNSLIDSLGEEIGTSNNEANLVLIGVGNIGLGLLKYNYIPSHIGQIVCAYDNDNKKIGTSINGVPIYSIDQLEKTLPQGCKIAILAIPKEALDDVVSRLANQNIKAIINFSDGSPRKRNNIMVYQVDLAKIVSEIIYDFKINKIDKEDVNV